MSLGNKLLAFSIGYSFCLLITSIKLWKKQENNKHEQ